MPDHMRSYLDFEKPVAELESKVDELRALAASGSDIADEISRIEDKAAQALSELYANLTPWQKTLVARHPQRPHFTDFIDGLITEFTPLAGDRKFGEDEALVGGFGRFRGESICVMGQEKGASTESRIKHNFGMSRGAIAITTANRVLMFEHAIYSVISPEAASSILWRDGTKAQEAANSMKITAQDMLRFGVIDTILREPVGGAHRDPAAMIADTGAAVAQAFDELGGLDADAIRAQRRQKFLDIGRKLG